MGALRAERQGPPATDRGTKSVVGGDILRIAQRPIRSWEQHGRECTPDCRDNAERSPLNRGRGWVRTPCPWCGAEPGDLCTVGMSGKRRRVALTEPHPSRREAVA